MAAYIAPINHNRIDSKMVASIMSTMKEIIAEMNLRITHTCKIWVWMLQYWLGITINQ